MLKKMRNIHLWISLVACLFIFIESASGLLLTHRWMMGVTSGGHNHSHSESHEHHEGKGLNIMDAVTKASKSGAFSMDQVSVVMNHGTYMVQLNDEVGTTVTISDEGEVISKAANPVAKFVRNIHVGVIGDMNVSWALDVAAISILVLTGTGLVLSVYILRAKNRSKNRLAQA